MRRGGCLLSRVRPSANKSMLLGALGLLGVREDLLGRGKGRLGTVRGFAPVTLGAVRCVEVTLEAGRAVGGSAGHDRTRRRPGIQLLLQAAAQ